MSYHVANSSHHNDMDVIHPLPAVLSVGLIFLLGNLLVRKFGSPPEQGRFIAIDGLRGYLAFFVFMHHSVIWYFYMKTNRWEVPPSNLYTHFGQTSVAFFFMITGFLFYTKLIDGRKTGVEWGRLYVSRLLRIFPLYGVVVAAIIIVVAILTNFQLNEPIGRIIREVLFWLSLTTLGGPDINGLEGTFIIVSGVTWSLPYECFFYLSLPLLALSAGVVAPPFYLLLGAAGAVGFFIFGPKSYHLMSFFAGIAAAICVRSEYYCRIARSKFSSAAIVAFLFIAINFYSSTYSAVPLALLAIAFSLMAAGNTLLGLLSHPVSRTLGEMAYSIFLIHGLLLFIAFKMILGVPVASQLTPVAYWLVILCITPILLVLSFLSFRFIESPSMRRTRALTAWLRSVWLGFRQHRSVHNGDPVVPGFQMTPEPLKARGVPVVQLSADFSENADGSASQR